MLLTDIEKFRINDYNKSEDEVLDEVIENDFMDALCELETNTVNEVQCYRYMYGAYEYMELFKKNKDVREYRKIYSGYLNRDMMKTIYREFLSDIVIERLKVDLKTVDYNKVVKVITEIDIVADIIDNM